MNRGEAGRNSHRLASFFAAARTSASTWTIFLTRGLQSMFRSCDLVRVRWAWICTDFRDRASRLGFETTGHSPFTLGLFHKSWPLPQVGWPNLSLLFCNGRRGATLRCAKPHKPGLSTV